MRERDRHQSNVVRVLSQDKLYSDVNSFRALAREEWGDYFFLCIWQDFFLVECWIGLNFYFCYRRAFERNESHETDFVGAEAWR